MRQAISFSRPRAHCPVCVCDNSGEVFFHIFHVITRVFAHRSQVHSAKRGAKGKRSRKKTNLHRAITIVDRNSMYQIIVIESI